FFHLLFLSQLDQNFQELYKNHRIQLLPIEHSAHVEDIVEFKTAIAQIFLYLRQDEKDPKKDPAYYPAHRGKDDDDESSNDDDNDDDVEKDEEDKEEEEHLAPADPSDVSTDDLVPSS
nr:hypothetical protein [Tanacetum cinerariifolium]